MDRLTVKIIRGIIDERIDELKAQWDAMEHGTLESSSTLERMDELIEIKWTIIEAADVPFEGLRSI
jgi:hypothetical protein